MNKMAKFLITNLSFLIFELISTHEQNGKVSHHKFKFLDLFVFCARDEKVFEKILKRTFTFFPLSDN